MFLFSFAVSPLLHFAFPRLVYFPSSCCCELCFHTIPSFFHFRFFQQQFNTVMMLEFYFYTFFLLETTDIYAATFGNDDRLMENLNKVRIKCHQRLETADNWCFRSFSKIICRFLAKLLSSFESRVGYKSKLSGRKLRISPHRKLKCLKIFLVLLVDC